MVPSATGGITAPTGWTLVTSAAGNGLTAKTFWAAGNVASLTFTLSGTTQGAVGVVVCYSGVDNTTPMDVAGAGQTNAASANCTAPSITAVTNAAFAVFCGTYNDTAGGNVAAWTGGVGTKRTSGGLRRSPTNTVSVAVFDQSVLAGAPTGAVAEAIGGTFTNAGFQVVLRPAATGTTFSDSITESGAASDSFANAATFANSLSEAGAAADALSNTATFVESYSEAGAAADTLASAATFPNAITEAASATDSVANGNLFSESITEGAASSDSVSAVQLFAESLPEALAASDSLASVGTFPNAISEASVAADSYLAGLVISESFSEAGLAADSVSAPGGVTYNESITEALSAGAGTGGNGAIFIFDD